MKPESTSSGEIDEPKGKPMSRRRADGLKEKLERVAGAMADDLLAGTTPTKGAVETFKVLAGFFVGSRSKGLEGDGEDTAGDAGFSFTKAKAGLTSKEQKP